MMRLSKQLLESALHQPPQISQVRTSALLSRGLVASLVGPGLPVYTPLGLEILDRLESALINAAVHYGFDRFGLPSLMKNDDLFAGETVGKQFLSKIVFLQESLKEYHLLTTPEMMFVRMSQSSFFSHRSFPLRCTYTTNIFRSMSETKSIITCRQFRVFGCMSLHTTMAGALEGLQTITDLSMRVMSDFGIDVREVRRDMPLRSELLYPTIEGDAYLDLSGTRQKALSLAIGYQYGANTLIPIDYRSESNSVEHPLMITFALCTNRLLFAVFDAHRDALGFALPPNLRPFDVILIPRAEADLPLAERVTTAFSYSGIRAALDDRVGWPIDDRRNFANYIGTGATLVVHNSVLYGSRRGSSLSYTNGIDEGNAVAAISSLIDK